MFAALLILCALHQTTHLTQATPLNTGAVTFREYRVYQVNLPDNFDQFDQYLQWISSVNGSETPRSDPHYDFVSRSASNQSDSTANHNLIYKHSYLNHLLNELEETAPLDYWSRNESGSLFMVAPDYQPLVEDYLLNNSLNYQIVIEDVQQLIDQEKTDNLAHSLSGRTSIDEFDFEKYHTYEKIVEYLQQLEMKHRNFVKFSSIGRTYEQNKIPAVKIGPKSDQNRPTIVIDAGIHAREWIAPASALYLIRELSRVFNGNETAANHTSNILRYDWIVVPVANPDGYIYSYWHNRMWRKNRNVPKTIPIRAPWHWFQSCVGADPNRNFDLDFGKASTSSNPCSSIFAGDFAFSERESIAIRDLILEKRPLSYVSLHSYSQLLMFPNGAFRSHVPNHDELKSIAGQMARAMAALYKTQYRYGPISQTIYPASGSSTDWSYWKGHVKYPFVFELRDTGKYGFMLPNNQILPTGEEVWKAINVLADQLVSKISP